MMAWRRTIAAGCAVLAFLGSLATCGIVTPWLLTKYYGWGHPEDGSAGDSAGWAFLLLAPLEIPVFLTVAVVVSLFAYSFAMKRTGSRLSAEASKAGSDKISLSKNSN